MTVFWLRKDEAAALVVCEAFGVDVTSSMWTSRLLGRVLKRHLLDLRESRRFGTEPWRVAAALEASAASGRGDLVDLGIVEEAGEGPSWRLTALGEAMATAFALVSGPDTES